VTAVYAAVEAIVQAADLPTASVCAVLDVCRSAYYAWRDGELSGRDQREAALTPLIRAMFWKHRRRYGVLLETFGWQTEKIGPTDCSLVLPSRCQKISTTF
jgi:hypothetical protein